MNIAENERYLEIVNVFSEEKLILNFYLMEEETRLHFKVIVNNRKEQ